jgi:hypothetical protein
MQHLVIDTDIFSEKLLIRNIQKPKRKERKKETTQELLHASEAAAYACMLPSLAEGPGRHSMLDKRNCESAEE